MQTSKEIKRKSIDLIARRPVNLVLPALFSVILLIIVNGGHSLASLVNYNSVALLLNLLILIYFFDTGYSYFLLKNRSKLTKRLTGHIESSIISYHENGCWTSLGIRLMIFLINVAIFCFIMVAMFNAMFDGGGWTNFWLGITIGVFLIFNFITANLKYAFIDQFTANTLISKQKNILPLDWTDKLTNAMKISFELMSDEKFLWEWFKLTCTSILWILFSILLFNLPLIIVYPYIRLCYIKLYDAGIEYLKKSSSNNRIPNLIFATGQKKHHAKSAANKALINGTTTYSLLMKVRKWKKEFKSNFTGPTEAEQKQAEQILHPEQNTKKSQKNRKNNYQKEFQQYKKRQNRKQQNKLNLNQPNTNPKAKINKVMRKNHGRKQQN